MLELTPSSPTRQPRPTTSPSLGRRLPIAAAAALTLLALTTPEADAQDRWTPVGSPGPLVGVLVDPLDSSTLYARGYFRGLSKSTDGGQSWAPIHQGLTEDGEPPGVAALAIDPLDTRVLYAAVHFPQPPFGEPISRLFKTVDGGLHWTPISSPAGALVEILDVDPQQPSILLAGGRGGSFRSTDGGTTWVRLAGTFGQYSLFALARDPAAPAVMYASASEYPVDTLPDAEAFLFKSVDGGATWTAVAQRPLFALAVVPGGSKLYASDGSTRVLQSVDGGVTWTRAALLVEITRLLVDPTSPTTLFAVGRDGVWKSDDGGTIFRSWNDGLGNRDVTDLAFDPQTPARLYATNLDGLNARLSSSVTPAPGCDAGSTTQLCLEGGRFRVEVAWKDFSGNSGVGSTRTLTDDTGAFWFFGPDNIELTVKILDGRPVNGKFWVFYGSLTNVEFTLTVTDTATHRQRHYHNPMGTFASAGHTDSF